MIREDVRSLKQLRNRKRQVRKEIFSCEDRILDDYNRFTKPVDLLISPLLNGGFNLSVGGIIQTIIKTKGVVDLFRNFRKSRKKTT